MLVEIFVSYAVGTLTGIWLSRTFWMVAGASQAYEIMMEAQQRAVNELIEQREDNVDD